MKIGECLGKVFDIELKQKITFVFSKIRDIALRILVGIGQVFAAVAAVGIHLLFSGVVIMGVFSIAYTIYEAFSNR